MKLYSMPSSGNSYKVRLLLALLGRDVATVDVEAGSDALAEARARLPFGKAPVLELDDGTQLPESNAILCYLGQGTLYLPPDPRLQAQMLAWMFWEQNQHEPVIAVRMAHCTYPHRKSEATPERMAELLIRGQALLGFMDQHLQGRDWLVGTAPSLADICLYGYTHGAESIGGFDLHPLPHLRDWLARMAGLPGYVGLHD